MDVHNDELDQWLDDALANYKAPAPRPGLELRTMAYVRSNAVERRFGLWAKWALVGTAAVAVIVALALIVRTTKPPIAQPIQRATGPQPTVAGPQNAAEARSGATGLQRKIGPRRVLATVPAPERANVEPRLAVFPAPLPLTAEEKMLLALTRRSPEKLAEIARADVEVAPIVIEDIKIKALEERDQSSTGGKK